MIPTRIEAERLLREAEKDNPGPWGNHSRITAHCAEKIAGLCDGLYAEKAYVLGLLHDIGRKFGVRHLGHVSDGYTYWDMMKSQRFALRTHFTINRRKIILENLIPLMKNWN